ncbi:MAG: patatin-like phospholipase family protein [Streptosporangiaceae bacterium]
MPVPARSRSARPIPPRRIRPPAWALAVGHSRTARYGRAVPGTLRLSTGTLHQATDSERTMLITAVDARTGEPVVFDRHSGAGLVDAVAASTANGFGVPPYRIGGNRYIDGGYRRNENADLAAGYGRVLVLSPFGGRSRHPPQWGMDLAAQAGELRAGGSTVETIFPDGNSLSAFGTSMMDPSTRPDSTGAALALRAGTKRCWWCQRCAEPEDLEEHA